MARTSHRAGLAAAFLLAAVLSAVSAWALAPDALGLFHDDGLYAVAGKALANGNGYRIVSAPGAPAQTKYPPVYSALLSLVWRIAPDFPANVFWLKAPNTLALFAALLLAYVVFRRLGEPVTWALSGMVLLGANPMVLSFTDYTMSDILFVVWILATLAIWEEPQDRPMAPRRFVGAAILIGLACLTRGVGISMAVAAFAVLLWRRDRRALVWTSVIVATFIVPWIAWTRLHGGPESNVLLAYYVGYERDAMASLASHPRAFVDVVWANARYAISAADFGILGPAMPALRLWVVPVGLIGGCSILAGSSLLLRAFVAFYVALVLVYPFAPARYVLPLMPFVVLALVRGTRLVADALQRRASVRSVDLVRALAIAPLLISAMLTTAWARHYVEGRTGAVVRGWYGQRFSYDWHGFEETITWIREHTGATDVLASAYDPLYYLHTGRQAIRPWIHRPETYFYPYGRSRPDVGSAETIVTALDALGVRYLVVDPMDGYSERVPVEALFTDLTGAGKAFPTLVFASEDGEHRVYRRSP